LTRRRKKCVLKIDIDNIKGKIPKDWMLAKAWHIIGDMQRIYGRDAVFFSREWSEHGGLHLRITIPENLGDEWIARLQYVLGDDPYRSMRNLQRIRHGLSRWNKFFQGSRG